MINLPLLLNQIDFRIIDFQSCQEPIIAIWWFLPLIIGGVGGALIGTIAIIASGDDAKETYKGKKLVNLAILGPNAAGKTTLWNYLKGVPSSKTYQETSEKTSMHFVASGITWNAIKSDISERGCAFKGYDINGHGDFIRTEWASLVNDSKMILFIFNAYKYLNNVEYQRDVNQRLQFVKNCLDKKNDSSTHVWILGSHSDSLRDKKNDWEKIIGMIRQKPYSDLSHNNACLNLTNSDELKGYFNKMFN